MTSTVLDVTVFLLCVSASVGTLLAGSPGPVDDAPDAQATADRIATVTGTVRFTVSDENGVRERRHQATLSVLLANAVLAASADDSAPPNRSVVVAPDEDRSGADDSSAGDPRGRTYQEAVVELVSERIGPRTRVVAQPEDQSVEIGVGSKPPRDADVAVAAFSVPAGSGSEYVRIVVRRWSHA
ncbi:MAG: hypothetical protein ABEH81_11155 [Halopenitus sp.]